MPLAITVSVNDRATPALAAVGASLKDRRALHTAIAGTIEDITAAHIRIAAQTRHKTATRLGASPTGYLNTKADTIESVADNAGVVMTVWGAIFKRVTGDVPVVPVNKKWLAIPALAQAYGRRPGEFGKLSFRKNKSGGARLVNEDGDVLFWLVKKVTLPQDRGLLPSDEQFSQAAELGARGFLEQQIAAAQGNGFTPPGGYSRA